MGGLNFTNSVPAASTRLMGWKSSSLRNSVARAQPNTGAPMVEPTETKPATAKNWRDKSLSPQERFELITADPDASVEETEWPAILEAYTASELSSLAHQALDILIAELKRELESRRVRAVAGVGAKQ